MKLSRIVLQAIKQPIRSPARSKALKATSSDHRACGGDIGSIATPRQYDSHGFEAASDCGNPSIACASVA
jgi:hypothetical protein